MPEHEVLTTHLCHNQITKQVTHLTKIHSTMTALHFTTCNIHTIMSWKSRLVIIIYLNIFNSQLMTEASNSKTILSWEYLFCK